MLYLLDRCIHDGVRKRLRALGYDCEGWKGDLNAKDRVIAVQAEAVGRVLISGDWDFVEIHRNARVSLGWHVHVIGPKSKQPDLLEARIAELDAKIKARGPGLYCLEEGKVIHFEKTGKYNRGRGKRKRARRRKKSQSKEC